MNLTAKELSKLTDDFFKTSNIENSSNDELVKNIHYCLNKNRINFSVESLLATFNSYKPVSYTHLTLPTKRIV